MALLETTLFLIQLHQQAAAALVHHSHQLGL
jgi:hypothetical protein